MVSGSDASSGVELAASDRPKANGTVDLYSETALEELEALGGADEDTTVVAHHNAAEPAEAGASAAAPSLPAHKGELSRDEAIESRDTFEEKPPVTAEDKAMRRRSWHEKSDRRANTIDEPSATKQEVKMRKAASIDVTRPANLKKLRTGETRPSKTTPSPVKATYRPMSMPIDNLVASLEEDLDKKSQDENSGQSAVQY